MNTLNPFISCPFCNARFPSGEFFREHMMMCKNKINQCLRSRQSIYDNNYSKIHDTSLPESTLFHVSLSLMTKNNETYSQTISQQSIRIRQIIFICQYCKQSYYQEDIRNIHQENCPMNPKNHVRISLDHTRNQLNNSDKTIGIYCKYCHVFFESNRFDDHKKSCEYIYQQSQEELRRRQEKISDIFHRCTYCGILFTKGGFKIHQKSCKRSRPYRIIDTITIRFFK